MSLRSLLVFVLAGFLAACAGSPPRETPAPVDTPPGESGRPVPAPAPPPVAPATDAVADLLARARDARESGETERALALLERAQRLDPVRGALYLELARTHAAAGDAAQAKAFAERGLLYCQGSECSALAPFTR
ncbi:tetratricopeptide repeat protein [Pseudohaliea rubra]|uniref:TPR repeat protein n=1 Tax=Pseudohaliea rubra DSM 19751 TaxID=1265313 RepID=A0A095VTB4_9GAMM|nr:tetratricopeptide repeat protein [Pseudohaliea rubra]KGE04575.1 TPR repeat protein [Pseudohaliea rubra DSM 19751]